MLHVRDDVSLKVSSLHRYIFNIAYIELYTILLINRLKISHAAYIEGKVYRSPPYTLGTGRSCPGLKCKKNYQKRGIEISVCDPSQLIGSQ